MYCRKCGATNDDNAFKCVNCGQVLQAGPVGGAPAQYVANHLVFAILVTIFCCWPFGIPAIVFAAQVNGKLGAGDYAGAVESSKKAAMWCWISFGLGVPAVIINILFVIASIVGAAEGM